MPASAEGPSTRERRGPRVLMIVRQFHPWIGGAERQAHKLAASLLRLGVDVKVVTGWWFDGTPQQEVIGTVPVYRHTTLKRWFNRPGLRRLGGYTYLLSLGWYLWTRRRDYDLLHVHVLNYHAFPAVLAGRWWGKGAIVKLANSGPRSDLRRMRKDELPGQARMLPAILRADRFIALNAESRAELLAAGVPAEKIAMIPNGVETDAAPPRDYTLGREMRVLYVGRLHPQKGIDILLRAFRQARDQRPERVWRLGLIGDGPSRAELERLTRQFGLTDHVRFYGQREDVTPQLAEAAVFALPSRSEGISNALLEAMAHGLPCVASAIGGNTDLIRSEENGLLTAAEDEAGLAAALVRLADDESLRRRLGAAARRTVEAGYSLESVARQYLALYQSLLESPAPREGEPVDHR